MRRLIAVLLCAVPSIAFAADPPSTPPPPVADPTPTADQSKRLETIEREHQQLRAALEAAAARPADRYMRHGITVGVAYSVHYPLSGETTLHGLQGGSATAYVATFPAYWFNSSGANAYCATQWSASDNAARAAESSASDDADEADRHLKTVRALLADEGVDLVKLRDAAFAALRAAAGPRCDPAVSALPGDTSPDGWQAWCNGKLALHDLEAAASQINAARTAVEALQPTQVTEAHVLMQIGCLGSLAGTSPDVTAPSLRESCGARKLEKIEALTGAGEAAARYALAQMLVEFNQEAAKQLRLSLDTDWDDGRRTLGYLLKDMWDELERERRVLHLEDADLYRNIVRARAALPQGDSKKLAQNWIEVLKVRPLLRAAYRVDILDRVADDLDEERQAMTITHPAICIVHKLGVYVGVSTPFEATVYMPTAPDAGLVVRDVSPTFSWGGVIAPNALFSMLIGASVGSVPRGEQGLDEGTEPILMGSLGIGGNLDLISVLR